jgi:hypothetical protein
VSKNIIDVSGAHPMPIANPRINGMLEKVKAAKAVADAALDDLSDHDVQVLLRLCVGRLKKVQTDETITSVVAGHLVGKA